MPHGSLAACLRMTEFNLDHHFSRLMDLPGGLNLVTSARLSQIESDE